MTNRPRIASSRRSSKSVKVTSRFNGLSLSLSLSLCVCVCVCVYMRKREHKYACPGRCGNNNRHWGARRSLKVRNLSYAEVRSSAAAAAVLMIRCNVSTSHAAFIPSAPPARARERERLYLLDLLWCVSCVRACVTLYATFARRVEREGS